jgi:hypothetical protein
MRLSALALVLFTAVLFAFCPLGLPPEEACSADNPLCALYQDNDGDDLCDNPEPQPESSSDQDTQLPPDSAQQADIPEVIAEEDDPVITEEFSEEVTESAVIIEETEIDVPEDSVIVDISETTYPLQIESSGCPLDLPPEAACPTPEDRLCPHFRGGESCINPSGGGVRRTQLIVIATTVLLFAATFLKRQYRGRRKTDRHRRKIAHIIIQTISILVLGFFVQGCYCPLGVFQYIFLPGGVGFLGGVGIAVLLLPALWSLFIGRIYCGWVCPFGALQDLLGKLNVPRPPAFPKKVHRFLINFKYVLAVAFIGALILTGKGFFGRIIPASLFCQIDPFHTIFSYFIVGSFTGAIASLCLLTFFPRFFCKYLCFYGAVLSVLGRARLWARISRRHKQ